MMQFRKLILALLLTLAIGLIAWLVETLVGRFRPNMGVLGRFLIFLGLSLSMLALAFGFAQGRDLGQWEANDPEIREWYQSLMQPDNANASCCGEADAYWADEIHVKDGKTYATITDDRPDEPRRRPHIDVGTVVEIPNHKLKWDKSNPTGHGVLFLSRAGYVYCFVQPGGA